MKPDVECELLVDKEDSVKWGSWCVDEGGKVGTLALAPFVDHFDLVIQLAICKLFSDSSQRIEESYHPSDLLFDSSSSFSLHSIIIRCQEKHQTEASGST
ncbi:unnamed protein product [Caretta caretta]